MILTSGTEQYLITCKNKKYIFLLTTTLTISDRKRFVRYKEGAEMYSMCQSKFEKMAKEANAVYKLDKLVLVNCDIFEAYLETFRTGI